MAPTRIPRTESEHRVDTRFIADGSNTNSPSLSVTSFILRNPSSVNRAAYQHKVKTFPYGVRTPFATRRTTYAPFRTSGRDAIGASPPTWGGRHGRSRIIAAGLFGDAYTAERRHIEALKDVPENLGSVTPMASATAMQPSGIALSVPLPRPLPLPMPPFPPPRPHPSSPCPPPSPVQNSVCLKSMHAS